MPTLTRRQEAAEEEGEAAVTGVEAPSRDLRDGVGQGARWRYKTDRTGARHAGPTAEDFHAAFQLGNDPTAIGTIDEAGISLIGIQALEARTAALRRENELLRAALARLEAQVSQLVRSR